LALAHSSRKSRLKSGCHVFGRVFSASPCKADSTPFNAPTPSSKAVS